MPKRRGTNRGPEVERDIRNLIGEQLEKALAFVRQRLDELPSLRDKEPFGDEYVRWSRVTNSALQQYFGSDSEEWWWVNPPAAAVEWGNAYESDLQRQARLQRQYQERLDEIATGLHSIIDKYAVLAPSAPPVTAVPERPARAFISHGGLKPSLTMIEEFLRALGVEPVVVEKRASESREVHDNVDVHRKQCDFAIVLWTKDVEDAQGRWLPSGSVAEEAGGLRNHFPKRVIYLKESGVTLPTMAATIQYQEFTEEKIGPAYFKIVTELKEWGFLTVAVPEDESAS